LQPEIVSVWPDLHDIRMVSIVQ